MSAPLSDNSSLPVGEVLPAISSDGARAEVLLQLPTGEVRDVIYWLPALGVTARQYLPLAQSLAERGIAVAIHEWRGFGSSNWRASRRCDWGYRELLMDDMPVGISALRARLPHARCWIGGHSLGGQLASLYASLSARDLAGLVLVASGSPYWRCFPRSWSIGLAYLMLPALARLLGYLPGRRIGFGGNEARRLIVDWARTGRTGRYAAAGVAEDIERRLGALELPLLALRMQNDWLAPADSLAWLLGKMPQNRAVSEVLLSADMGGQPADHFSWMKNPAAVTARIADWLASAS